MPPEDAIEKQAQNAIELIIRAYQTGWDRPGGRPPFVAHQLPNKRKIEKTLKAIVADFACGGKNIQKQADQADNIDKFISAVLAGLIPTLNGKYVHETHAQKIALLLSKKFQKTYKHYKQACANERKAHNAAEQTSKKADKNKGKVIEKEILDFYRTEFHLKIDSYETLIIQFSLSINNSDVPGIPTSFGHYQPNADRYITQLEAEKTYINAKIEALEKNKSEITAQIALLQEAIAYEKLSIKTPNIASEVEQNPKFTPKDSRHLLELKERKKKLESDSSQWDATYGLQLEVLREIREIIYDELKEKDAAKGEKLRQIKCEAYEEAKKINPLKFHIRKEIRDSARQELNESKSERLQLLKEIQEIARQELKETKSERLELLKEIRETAHKELEETQPERRKLLKEIREIARQELEETKPAKLEKLREIKALIYKELSEEKTEILKIWQEAKYSLYAELYSDNSTPIIHFCMILLMTGLALATVVLLEEEFLENAAEENTPDHSPVELLSCPSSTAQIVSFAEAPMNFTSPLVGSEVLATLQVTV